MTAFSIIIPIYNTKASLLKEALNSVLNQTLKDIEIIIVDDKSNIDYKTELKEYIQNTQIILYKNDKNEGSGNARNKGLHIAKGEFIAFLDADDFYIDNDALSKLYDIAKNTNENIIGGKPFVKRETTLEELTWSYKNKEKLYNNKSINYKDTQICYGYWNYIYKKDFLIKNNLYFNNLKRFQDPLWFYEVLTKNKTYYSSDITFYAHRERKLLDFNWTEETLKDYFKGFTILVEKTNNDKNYDLHTYLYRKALNWEFKLYINAREELGVNMSNELEILLNTFNFEIIKDFPIFKSVADLNNINFEDLKEFDY